MVDGSRASNVCCVLCAGSRASDPCAWPRGWWVALVRVVRSCGSGGCGGSRAGGVWMAVWVVGGSRAGGALVA